MLVFIALGLIFFDTKMSWLQSAHSWLGNVAQPFYWATNIPIRVKEWGSDLLLSRGQLEAENEKLSTEMLVYQGQLQRMADLTAENMRLRNLLNATELLADNVLITKLIAVSPDPLNHLITINRGTDDKVFVGQAVIDGDGLMGQVVDVYNNHSRVLLITDSRHALPVKVTRNGLRAIAEGGGDYQEIKLRHISPTHDIVVGDELVSSGLGGRFPEGYPVGRVTELIKHSGQNFIEVKIEPSAKIDRSRHLLLVYSGVIELVGNGYLSEH